VFVKKIDCINFAAFTKLANYENHIAHNQQQPTGIEILLLEEAEELGVFRECMSMDSNIMICKQ
jgi:hypothetical protein